MTRVNSTTTYRIAKLFHERYERYSQKKSRVSFANLPTANKKTMLKTTEDVLLFLKENPQLLDDRK